MTTERDNPTWRARLRAARLFRGLTQAQLAAELGRSQPTIAQWELGDSQPPVDTFERIAAALECSPSWLAFGRGRGPAGPEKVTKQAD